MKPNPPLVPQDYNPVGSYRREISVDKNWDGKDIYIQFGAVRSCMYLWVNGQWVGYSEDSKLPAEFNITKYIKPGRKTSLPFSYTVGVMVRIWNVRICGGFPVLPATPGFMHANLSISEIYKLPEIWTKL